VLPRLTSVGEPDWSPDGSTIAYTHSTLDRRYNFRPSIRAIPAAGGAPRLLIRDAQSPDWSPDGTRLAFADVRDHNGRYCGSDECWFAGEIYTAAADGSGAARLTRNEGADGDPQWSPDGSRILFTSDQNLPEADAAEVYSIAADGSCLTWLTNGTPASGGAAWRSGTGARFDPGSCDPATRPALVDTPRLPRLRGGLWLGPEHRGLLLSLSSEPVCRPRSIRGLATNAYRFLRMRGALVAYYRLEASIRVLSGRTVTSIDLGFDTRLADVRRVVRSLRTYTASAPPDRLAAPRIPGGERVGPGPFRRALRSFGPLRYAGC